MKARTLALVSLVVLTIVIALVSAIEYAELGFVENENSQLSQAIANASRGTLLVNYYNTTSIVLPVSCCPDLPDGIVLNNTVYLQIFDYAPPPPTTVNGTIYALSAGVLLIFQASKGSSTQNVSFRWSGTFGETPPTPSSAIALNGTVNFLWFVNSGGLNLEIQTTK